MLECFSRLNLEWLNRAYVYTGSVGPVLHDFRYRWALDGENKLIRAAVYSGICYEKAAAAERRDFPWDSGGVEELKAWLQERYEQFAAGQLSAGGPGA